MDVIQWLVDLLPGHHHSHDAHGPSGLAATDPVPHPAGDGLATGHPAGLGVGHYQTLAGAPATPTAPTTSALDPAPTGNAFLDQLNTTMAGIQGDTDTYLAHLQAAPTGAYGSNTDFVLALQDQMHQAGDIYHGALDDLGNAPHLGTGTTGPGPAGAGDPYHFTDSLLQADTAVGSTENDVAIWDNTLATENQVDSALAGDEGL
jgi:hypothetical protein